MRPTVPKSLAFILTVILIETGHLSGQTTNTVTFDLIPNQVLGISPFPIAARSSSGLAVSLNSTTPSVCTTAGALVTLLETGTCSITASQPGNSQYQAA